VPTTTGRDFAPESIPSVPELHSLIAVVINAELVIVLFGEPELE
jgi:hypothetical protein